MRFVVQMVANIVYYSTLLVYLYPTSHQVCGIMVHKLLVKNPKLTSIYLSKRTAWSHCNTEEVCCPAGCKLHILYYLLSIFIALHTKYVHVMAVKVKLQQGAVLMVILLVVMWRILLIRLPHSIGLRLKGMAQTPWSWCWIYGSASMFDTRISSGNCCGGWKLCPTSIWRCNSNKDLLLSNVELTNNRICYFISNLWQLQDINWTNIMYMFDEAFPTELVLYWKNLQVLRKYGKEWFRFINLKTIRLRIVKPKKWHFGIMFRFCSKLKKFYTGSLQACI